MVIDIPRSVRSDVAGEFTGTAATERTEGEAVFCRSREVGLNPICTAKLLLYTLRLK